MCLLTLVVGGTGKVLVCNVHVWQAVCGAFISFTWYYHPTSIYYSNLLGKKIWTIFVQSYSVMEKSIRYSHHFRTIWAQFSLFSINISSFWDQNKETDHGLFEHLLEIPPQRDQKSIHCRRTASECAWQMVKKPRNVIWLHKSKCIWKRSSNFSHEYHF